jgi:hypothetical protein
MKFPGLYRRYNEAPIVPAEYDVPSQSLLDLKFPLPYEYVEEYAVDFDHLDDLKLSTMYDAFLKRKEILAVVLINNDYVAMLYPNKVFTVHTGDEENEDNITIDSFYDYSTYANEPIVPVGFERTFCKTASALITPGRIFYNPETKKVFYKNKWCALPNGMEPKEYKKKDLYKKLVSTPEGKGIICVGEGKTQLLT